MKILVCGLGSIGERHVGNLLSLGYDDIIVYRKRELPLRTLDKQFPVFTSLDTALLEKPEVAIICNPTHLHHDTTERCLKGGCHVLVEKPISHTSDGLSGLSALAESLSLQVMVGYMMRFHPCLIRIKEWLKAGDIGKLVYIRSQWGEYLPDWHPWEDYRKSYAALMSMGGGPGLTLSHELDTLLWLGGDYSRAMGLCNYGSSLEVDTEHGVDLLIQFENGATGNVHMDYFQSPPARTLELVGTNGRIEFDYFRSRAVRYAGGESQLCDVCDVSENFDRNNLFVDELRYFLGQVQANSEVKPGVKEGSQVLKLLEEAIGKR